MELRHLRYFTAVAKHLNLSEASRRPVAGLAALRAWMSRDDTAS
jgi:DNA-binding transcriptional LysR family regulator